MYVQGLTGKTAEIAHSTRSLRVCKRTYVRVGVFNESGNYVRPQLDGGSCRASFRFSPNFRNTLRIYIRISRPISFNKHSQT